MRLLPYLLLVVSLQAQSNKADQYSFIRIFEKAAETPGWEKLTLNEQIMTVRAAALRQKTVSNPVSDRYTITAYGGPIDLVHFLMLASEALKSKINIKERLYKEWLQEGGPQHQHGFNPSYPCEAHPDDLPSNALGALFGSELRNREKVNLLAEFKKFISPLKPVPDNFFKKLSHRRCVMGLKEKEDTKTEQSRYIWFSAEPLNLSGLINSISTGLTGKKFCKTVKSGKEGLAAAGLTVKSYRGKSIVISRL